MRILPADLVAGMTGVVSWMQALLRRFNLVSRTEFNVRDDDYDADNTGVLDASTALTDAYLDAKLQSGGKLVIPAGTYRIEEDLDWDSLLVEVEGAGSACTILQLVGTAQINWRPAVFSVTQGPKVSGLTIKGDPSAPPNATGIYSGDIIAGELDDVVIEGFAGAGSVGLHFRNQTHWTELNRLRRIRVDNCTVGIKCSVDGAAVSNSFARQTWEVHFNLYEDQVGLRCEDNALLYGQHGYFDGNALGNDVIFLDMQGTSSMSGNIDGDFEMTGAFTGVRGLREATSPGYQFTCTGVRNYVQSMTPDGAGGQDLFTTFGLRIRQGAVDARMGAVSLVGGTWTVNTLAVKDASAGQRIFLTRQLGLPGGARGHLEIGDRIEGESFVIKAMDDAGNLVNDVSVVSWMIVENWQA